VDALTRAAIAGTSREAAPASGLPTDNLLGSAAGMSPERNLLLRAGMHAVYRAAGRRAETRLSQVLLRDENACSILGCPASYPLTMRLLWVLRLSATR
jgi:hypothetical protein